MSSTAKEFNVASSVFNKNNDATDINEITDVRSELTLKFSSSENVSSDTFNINENQRVLHLQSDENNLQDIKIVTDDLSVDTVNFKTTIENIHEYVRTQKPSDYDTFLSDYTSTTQDIISKTINGDDTNESDKGTKGDIKKTQNEAIVQQAVSTVASMQVASDNINSYLQDTIDNLKNIETNETTVRETAKDIFDAIENVTGLEPPRYLSIDNVARINVLVGDNAMSNYSHIEASTLATFLSSNTHDATVYTENDGGKVLLTISENATRVLAINDRITDANLTKSKRYLYDRTNSQVKEHDWDTETTLTVTTKKDGTAGTQVLEDAQLVHYDCDITLTDSNGTEYKLVIMPSIETTFQFYKTDEPGAWAMDGHPVQTTASETPVVEYIVVAYEATGNPKDNAVPFIINDLNVSGGTLSQSFAFVNVSELDDTKVAVMYHEHVSNAPGSEIHGCFKKLKYTDGSGVGFVDQLVNDTGDKLYKVPSQYLSRSREMLVVETGSLLGDGVDNIKHSLTTATETFNNKLNNTVPPLFASKINDFTDSVYDTNDNYLQRRAALKTALGDHVTNLTNDTKLDTLQTGITRSALLNVLENNTAVTIQTDYFEGLTTDNNMRIQYTGNDLNNAPPTIHSTYPGDQWGTVLGGSYLPTNVRSVTYSDASSSDFDNDTNTYKAILEILERLVLYGVNTTEIEDTVSEGIPSN
jgi:hypothetical protein